MKRISTAVGLFGLFRLASSAMVWTDTTSRGSSHVQCMPPTVDQMPQSRISQRTVTYIRVSTHTAAYAARLSPVTRPRALEHRGLWGIRACLRLANDPWWHQHRAVSARGRLTGHRYSLLFQSRSGDNRPGVSSYCPRRSIDTRRCNLFSHESFYCVNLSSRRCVRYRQSRCCLPQVNWTPKERGTNFTCLPALSLRSFQAIYSVSIRLYLLSIGTARSSAKRRLIRSQVLLSNAISCSTIDLGLLHCKTKAQPGLQIPEYSPTLELYEAT